MSATRPTTRSEREADRPAAAPDRMPADAPAARRGTTALVFVVALLVRLAWVVHLPPDRLMWSDEREFLDVARHLARGDGYVATSYRANPVLPAYLAAVFATVGEHFAAARVGQAVVGAATCALVYRFAALLLGAPVGLLAGGFLAFYLPHVYVAGVFYVDCLLAFLSVLALHLAVRSTRPRISLPLGLLCGLVVGLTALTRGLYILYLPCVCAAWLYLPAPALRRRLALCAMGVLGTALVLAPWAFRNQRAYGRVVLVSSGFGANLWQGSNPLARGDANDRFLSPHNGRAEVEARLASEPEAERRAAAEAYEAAVRRIDERAAQVGDVFLAQDDVLGPLAVQWIRAHPQRAALLTLTRVTTLFSAFSATQSQNEHTQWLYSVAAAVSFYPVLLLAILGMALALPRRRQLAILYLPIVGVVGAYAALTACTRFRLPIDPLLIIFAAFAARELWRWRRPDRFFVLPPPASPGGTGVSSGTPRS